MSYIDDFIVFSKTPEQDLERLKMVFERFREANLKSNPSKCDCFRTQVPFLGHIVSKEGPQADPSKVEAVKTFPIPKNQTEVKTLIGLASYCRRFVSNFAEIARPLHKASETSSKFSWNTDAEHAFDKLKMTSTKINRMKINLEAYILFDWTNGMMIH